MNTPLVLACFSATMTCVLLQTNDTGILNSDNILDDSLLLTTHADILNSETKLGDSSPNNYHNSTEDEVQIEIFPAVNEGHQPVMNDSVGMDGFDHVDTSSSDVPLYVVGKFAHCFNLPNTCRTPSFLDIILGCKEFGQFQSGEFEGSNVIHLRTEVKKLACVPRNASDLNAPLVRIVNSSELLQQLGSRNATNGRCTVVLFYAPWCVFSAQVAPHYNALARAFPMLDVVAIDAFHFSNLNSRFGTIAVPNVMIFHSAKAVARFNGSERTLECLTSFVSNVTGMQANSSVEVTEDDYIGPLQSEPTQEIDYLLLLSWLFVILCCIMGAVRSSAGVRVWNTLVAMGHHEQHHHQHID